MNVRWTVASAVNFDYEYLRNMFALWKRFRTTSIPPTGDWQQRVLGLDMNRPHYEGFFVIGGRDSIAIWLEQQGEGAVIRWNLPPSQQHGPYIQVARLRQPLAKDLTILCITPVEFESDGGAGEIRLYVGHDVSKPPISWTDGVETKTLAKVMRVLKEKQSAVDRKGAETRHAVKELGKAGMALAKERERVRQKLGYKRPNPDF